MRERELPAETGRKDLPDGRLEVRLRLDGIDEVTWWVLGFGAECEVKEPEALKARVLQHARRVLDGE